MSDTQPKLAIRTTSKALSTQYDVMFDRQIDHANEWQEELYVLRQAGESDVCNVHINTCGGAVSTISAFQNIKKNSPAHFHGILEGIGYSAGSAFFLMCDTYEVGDFAEMMIHTSQGGFGGSSQGNEASGSQMARSAKRLVETVYKDFLTDQEIEDVLKGMEIWLDSDQIKERLANREAIRNQQAVEEAKETYTPEVYASACVQDILEDCSGFEYDPVTIIESMLDEVKSLAEEREMTSKLSEDYVEDDTEITFDGATLFFGDVGYNILYATRDDLVWIAERLGIKCAWNISEEKLRQRIVDFLNDEG